MVRLDAIQSLTDFQRNTKKHLLRLKKTGRPEVLTVNGQAELVVQDAKSYQKLQDRAEKADRILELHSRIADYRAGHFSDAEEVLEKLEAKHLSPTSARKRKAR